MATLEAAPLSTLAPTPVVVVEQKPVVYNMTSGWGALILWFIIIAVITWFILYSLRPTWVQRKDSNGQPTGAIDAGRVLLASIVIALIIVIIVWLIRGSCARF